MLCVKCKKRQAVFFVTKIENNKQSQEGYCLQCAKELNIGPINQIMEKMGIGRKIPCTNRILIFASYLPHIKR